MLRAIIITGGLLFLLIMLAETANARWRFDGPISNEVDCMALNIYFEARNQIKEGQLAVAHVTWNRVNNKHYPDSICSVVWQQNEHRKSGTISAQFSWTLDGKSDVPKNKKLYQEIRNLVIDFLVVKPEDPMGGATHYHTIDVFPYWANPKVKNSLTRIAKVDKHIFYK